MRRKSFSGFTLIEVMIVIAIIGIMAVIAAPNFTQYMKSRRLSGATMQLYVDLTNARMQAVSQNNKVIVALISNNSYQIIRDLNGNGVVDTGETGVTRSIHPDYHDVTFSTTFNPVFYANGTGKNPTITITSSSLATTKTITISTAGRVKIN